ncbi:ABC transporter ATP-binding protein [Vagococcus fluvialis]|uniref:ABC transporter ATP-binding protein n=1 Tax=Vagococcus fluvialis TaxID=2738 RepID=UPI001A8F11D5|nr:ABC transporter ATP-binding protein [Vagococcus fluvialis]MBO0478542.1 ABC transporter ATP-binding protein [Vagococcus fluvialis]MBO0485620.1 ABC transporter ATP-binding protein [Vagococcus fluvialis]
MTSIIELKKISKTFGEKKVLKNISLSIEKGECVALLGKNGAGKSTLINLILNLFYPTEGSIILAYEKKEIGFLSQRTRFPDDVTIKEMLDFVSSFSDNPLSEEEIGAILPFEKEKYNQLVATCSGGEQRLVDTCLAIINRPKLLIVDEPTASMDTSTRNHFWHLIKELKQKGTTILFTTHYVEEVDYCADRVILLDQGEIRADNTPYHLRTLNKKKVITIENDIYLEYKLQLEALINEFHVTIEPKKDVVVWHLKNEQTTELLKRLLQLEMPFDNIEITNTSLLETIFANELEEEEEI